MVILMVQYNFTVIAVPYLMMVRYGTQSRRLLTCIVIQRERGGTTRYIMVERGIDQLTDRHLFNIAALFAFSSVL